MNTDNTMTKTVLLNYVDWSAQVMDNRRKNRKEQREENMWKWKGRERNGSP